MPQVNQIICYYVNRSHECVIKNGNLSVLVIAIQYHDLMSIWDHRHIPY